jgi:predicted RNase H-like HicB family nuclease
MQRFYLAVIEKGRGGYGVFFPDLPGCTSFGPAVAKAAENAYVAAQAHRAITLEHGEQLPNPRAPEQIPADPEVNEAARLLVPVEIGDELVRVNVSLPETALAALDRTAKELSLTRSGAIAHLALTRQATPNRSAIGKRTARGRKAKRSGKRAGASGRRR